MMLKRLQQVATYGFLAVAAFVSIFPFYWMVVSATNASIDVTRGRLTPGGALLDNWTALGTMADFGNAFWNSTQIGVTSTLLSLAIASLAGYGFEIYQSRAKEMLFKILLLSMMVPAAALMVPLFRLFANLGRTVPAVGINTFPAVMLPGIATAFLIFFFRQSTKMFPKEILDAGRMDGLSELGIFLFIFVPAMKTTYAAAAIITFMASWNSFLWPLVVIQTQSNQTLPLLISNLGASYSPMFGVLMLAVVLATLPVAVVFFLLQKHFVAGMMGSIK